MKVKVGDQVKILAGKDKGKEGKVIKTLRLTNKVLVESINIIKKHTKPNNKSEKGGIFEIEAPIHVSNVKVIVGSNKTEKKTKKKAVEKKVIEKKAESKPKKTTKKIEKAS